MPNSHARRKPLLLRSLSLLALMLSLTATTHADNIAIPYQTFVLDNGLTLIVHEDRKAPLVAINLWYQVGSKNEKAGQTGFAHLFEHLMFNGSEHFNDEYFRPFEKAGATDMNGTTSNDRTNYFATVPAPALDMALWMESDRMAHLLPAIDQAKLDEQRGVVKNEKRQGEDRPFGRVREQISAATYPPGHPYSWEVIGSMRDLDAASLDDVREWFKRYYGPNNAVLVIAGAIDAQTAKQKVEQYFGSIPPSPPYARAQTWIAKRSDERRDVMQDRVPNARIYLVWNVPPFSDPVANQLDLVADMLAGDASGMLTRQLVQKEKLATSINAAVFGREIGGQFWITADAAPGVEPLQLEQRIRALLEQFKREGPAADALARAKVNYRAQFLRQLEKLGGFGGKTDTLATGAVFAGNPGFYQNILRDIDAASAEQLRGAARQWLDQGIYVMHVTPYPSLKTSNAQVDRSRVPDAGNAPVPNIPAIEHATLDNGLQLVLMRRPGLPLVEMELQLPSGAVADGWQHAGTGGFALQMLQESNGGLDNAAIAAKIRGLGASIDTDLRIDAAAVQLSALKEKLDPSVALFAQLITKPDFEAGAVERLRQQMLAQIRREESSAASFPSRLLPKLLFGSERPESAPLSGAGRSVVVENLTRDQLQQYHQRWFRPDQATLLAVGDIDMAQLRQVAQTHFGQWRGANDAAPAAAAPLDLPARNDTIYLVDLPGGAQASISAALALGNSPQLDISALNMANAAFGGAFTSRLNMNLREDKHWSYGTRSSLFESRTALLWTAGGGVQLDKTGPALGEMRREWREFVAQKPLLEDELEKVRTQRVRQLPGAYETDAELLQALAKNVRLRRPDSYLADESARLQQLQLDTVRQQATRLDPAGAVWLVVGDKQKILPQLQALGWGNVVEIDREGNRLAAKP